MLCFCETYTEHLSLFIQGDGRTLKCRTTNELSMAGVKVIEAAITDFSSAPGRVRIETDGVAMLFDGVYPMIGCTPRVELLKSFAPQLVANNLLWLDEHQCTSIPILYAAGDVVHALDQMSVGTAHATTAATAIHHTLPRNYR